MTGLRVVAVATVGSNLAFAALNTYMFCALGGHWYSLAAVAISVVAAGVCLWLAVRR